MKTSSPLDLHRIVDHDTVRAAAWFAYAARAMLGPPARKNILDNDPRPAEMSETKLGRLTSEYIAIQGQGRAERDVILDLLHFQQTPFWLLSTIAGAPTELARQGAAGVHDGGAGEADAAVERLPPGRPPARRSAWSRAPPNE